MKTPAILGSDPELFLMDHFGDWRSAIGLIGGSKENPRPVLGRAGFAVQEDNVALEFNIPPSATRNEWVNNLTSMLNFLEIEVSKMGLQLAVKASAYFPKEQLQSEQAQAFGCDADFNAWTMEQNPKPVCDDNTFRTCGGHVHFSTKLPVIQVVRAMDLFLGIPSILLDPDTERRRLYGMAGCFRFTRYGGEYRTLSNFWLKDPKFMAWVWDQTQSAIQFVEDNVELDDEDFLASKAEAIQKCINTSDKDLARTFDVTLP